MCTYSITGEHRRCERAEKLHFIRVVPAGFSCIILSDAVVKAADWEWLRKELRQGEVGHWVI